MAPHTAALSSTTRIQALRDMRIEAQATPFLRQTQYGYAYVSVLERLSKLKFRINDKRINCS
jgi:hypothetical protein